MKDWVTDKVGWQIISNDEVSLLLPAATLVTQVQLLSCTCMYTCVSLQWLFHKSQMQNTQIHTHREIFQ